ncbi:MAG: TraB/GumN family protein [bacterium]|nr:TraB/GumN family protein [bacterium]
MSAEEPAAEPELDGPPAEGEPYPPEVRFLDLDGRQVILVGTAHVSRSSVDLVRRVIERERPDCVCVELDAHRYESLAKEKKWESLDLKQIIRKKQLPTLLLNLLLAAYQKRLGGELGVQPGRELLEAARVADEHGIPIELCDRDVRVTLRRASHATSFFRKLLLMSELLVAMFDTTEISEEQLEKLKDKDVLTELMDDLGRALPALKRVLIDERDDYLSERLRRSVGDRIVGVVGAGHLEGICRALGEERQVDLDALSTIPPVSGFWKVAGWGVPLAILGALGWIGFTQGADEMGEDIVFWILANAIPTAIGGILAMAHPLTILAGFVAAPLTSLTPVIGAAYVTAFVQAWVRPPVVKEFQTVADDLMVLRKWWQNKLLKIFLAFMLPGFGSILGSLLGGGKIFSSLFR